MMPEVFRFFRIRLYFTGIIRMNDGRLLKNAEEAVFTGILSVMG